MKKFRFKNESGFNEEAFFFKALPIITALFVLALLFAALTFCVDSVGATPINGAHSAEKSLDAPVPPEYDISALSPATKRFVQWLTLFKNVQFNVSFQHKSLYRADWEGTSAGKVRGAYRFYDNWGISHVRLLLMDPPLVLNGYRGFQPDMYFVNPGGEVPEYDPGFVPLYYRWLSRPELDLVKLVETDELYQRIWADSLKVLRNADGTFNEEIVEAFRKMGLEDDGFPPHIPAPEANAERFTQLVNQHLDNSITYDAMLLPTEWYVFDRDYTVESIHPENFSTHMTLVKETELDWVVTQFEVLEMTKQGGIISNNNNPRSIGGDAVEVSLYEAPDYRIADMMDNIMVSALNLLGVGAVLFIGTLIFVGVLRKRHKAEKEKELV